MARPTEADLPLGGSLVVMKGVVVALLVAAAAFAPSPARADPTTTMLDRASDASDAASAPLGPGPDSISLETSQSVPDADPNPDPASGSKVDSAAVDSAASGVSKDPSHTLPPTDTVLPAVDSSH